jgi:hypothetical protein
MEVDFFFGAFLGVCLDDHIFFPSLGRQRTTVGGTRSIDGAVQQTQIQMEVDFSGAFSVSFWMIVFFSVRL